LLLFPLCTSRISQSFIHSFRRDSFQCFKGNPSISISHIAALSSSVLYCALVCLLVPVLCSTSLAGRICTIGCCVAVVERTTRCGSPASILLQVTLYERPVCKLSHPQQNRYFAHLSCSPTPACHPTPHFLHTHQAPARPSVFRRCRLVGSIGPPVLTLTFIQATTHFPCSSSVTQPPSTITNPQQQYQATQYQLFDSIARNTLRGLRNSHYIYHLLASRYSKLIAQDGGRRREVDVHSSTTYDVYQACYELHIWKIPEIRKLYHCCL
jgi:hypothetical protein